MATVPLVVFNNGRTCPAIGLGTWQSKSGEVAEAVKHAIDVGYRHIDCAQIYENEQEIGAALAAKFEEGLVKRLRDIIAIAGNRKVNLKTSSLQVIHPTRTYSTQILDPDCEDLFITSKLWCTSHRPDLVEGAVKTTLQDLGLEYLDLYLMHWPQAYKEGDDLFPVDEAGEVIPSAVDYIDTWKAMEALVDKGLTKSIGVSNFNKRQVERVMKNARIKPAVLQIEVHPYFNQAKLLELCSFLNIVVTAYAPLGSPDRPWAKSSDPLLLEDPRLISIADKYSKTVAQLLIRYALDRALIVIPKSVSKNRIEQNLAVFDFQLTPEDIDLIASLECKGRLCSMGDVHHPDYPFHDEY